MGAGEDSHGAAEPITAANRQLLPYRAPVLLQGVPGAASAPGRRDEFVRAGRQAAQLSQVQRNSQVKREHNRLHGMYGAEFPDFRTGDNRAPYSARCAAWCSTSVPDEGKNTLWCPPRQRTRYGGAPFAPSTRMISP
jgi:hypothetical protein